MNDGFYPALGTPVDSSGTLVADSFHKQIDLMIDAGAKGVLCMGSMGNMASIRTSQYPKVAKECFKAVSKRVPLMMGVMDCSISRVMDRIEALGDIQIDGVVATVPFYYKTNAGEIINFFKMLSKSSRFPVYIYDLPSVTQSPVTFGIMKNLMEMPNIKGVKTANLGLILDLYRHGLQKDNFLFFYSGLDLFDLALHSGISKNLDGMFTCTPFNSKKMYENIRQASSNVINMYLYNIIKLRNLFIQENVFSAYTYAMKLLGLPGNYHSDYDLPISENLKEEILSCMKEIKEI
jgi:dihydrodipicolinate synthase/N-acetylneuraminate lyase